MSTVKITGFQTRKELAIKYGLTERVFRQRLKDADLHFGAARSLSPKQVLLIIEKFGPWEMEINDPYTIL